jgi:hypothetical protein
MLFDSLIKALNLINKKDILIIEWNSGFKISGTVDTIFETNNGVEENDTEYLEYYEAVIKVHELLSHPRNGEGLVYRWFINGNSSYIGLSLYYDPPEKITFTNGNLVWQE